MDDLANFIKNITEVSIKGYEEGFKAGYEKGYKDASKKATEVIDEHIDNLERETPEWAKS
jgi:flagellar biosynthesis/type III secretory pathway protein FliH